jgi:hypothetical protein
LTFVTKYKKCCAAMTIQFWRLSEASDGNLGLACTADGLLLGRTPIANRALCVRRHGGRCEQFR